MPNPEGMLCIKHAFEEGMSVRNSFDFTAMDSWFLSPLEDLHQTRIWLQEQTLNRQVEKISLRSKDVDSGILKFPEPWAQFMNKCGMSRNH